MKRKEPGNSVKIGMKSVFEVDNSRLGIGVFNRPLLDHETRSFKRAWEREALPAFEDFQLDAKRVSFVARPEGVGEAWSAIGRVLATTTERIEKAS